MLLKNYLKEKHLKKLMEILDSLPLDIHWNVIKFLQHPLAGVLRQQAMCEECDKVIPLYHKCHYCRNRFCVRHMDYDKLQSPNGDYLVCAVCLDNRADEFVELLNNTNCSFHRGVFESRNDFFNKCKSCTRFVPEGFWRENEYYCKPCSFVIFEGGCYCGDRFNEGGCIYCNAEEESNIDSDIDIDSD